MGELPRDVMLYIEHRFAVEDQSQAIALLDQDHLRTARVLRSVLFLANGSLRLLEHNIDVCRNDLTAILTNAEYIVGAADKPVPIRDMSVPFTDERNLGADFRTLPAAAASRHRQPRKAPARKRYHQQIQRATFKLGFVRYVVAASQHHPDRVKCYRFAGTQNRVSYLPLVFVLEQLAEHVELQEAEAR